RHLLNLAATGATVVFEGDLPSEVPGWGNALARRQELTNLVGGLAGSWDPVDGALVAKTGAGRVVKGDLLPVLAAAGVPCEPMADQAGLMCVRRAIEGGRYYFIANRSEDKTVRRWVSLALTNSSVVLLDPLSGQTEAGTFESAPERATRVFLSLEPGESVILRCTEAFSTQTTGGRSTGNVPALDARPRASTEAGNMPVLRGYWEPAGRSVELEGLWQISFLQGGPVLPSGFETRHLASWTELGDTNTQRFAGTALYAISFDAPRQPSQAWQLDLGKVCHSARVRLNGKDLGTLFTPPFRVTASRLREKNNRLEVEVTNISANRIRDLDRRKVPWKNFYDINFVNLDYKPFDASNWPMFDSGLLGPVRLTPVRQTQMSPR
ncbi:MAG TPA: glycosylhydrolase-like jelly roll fold domain-containing protein, partial [Verrucomicrobiae bacterium]